MHKINIGTSPNDGQGDGLHEGGRKINENFEETDERLLALEQGGVGEAAISTDPSNRLKRGTDGGLFVSDEFDPDPLIHYRLAKG